MSMCNITVTGFASNPEVKDIGGNPITTISVAYKQNRKVDGQWVSETTWFTAEAGGSYGETLADKVQKGDYCIVSGQLNIRQGNNGKVYYNIRNASVETAPRGKTATAESDSGESPF